VEIAVVRYHTPNHRPHSRQRVAEWLIDRERAAKGGA
jgi:hypothetical protein